MFTILIIIYIAMTYIGKVTEVFKEWDLFYKKGQRFKWKLRPTIIDSWRAFSSSWHPRYGSYECPQKPRKQFADDYKSFKSQWWDQEVYLKVNEKYDWDAAAWLVQVYTPIYQIDKDRIGQIYNIERWWYPISLFIVEPIKYFPREDWVVTPWEKIIDAANIYWWDADMFVALRGFQVVKWNNTLIECQDGSMTWAWHYIPNPYNPWYDYIDGRLVAHEKDDWDD